MNKLTLSRLNDHVYRVLSGQGEHVGNLKFVNGVWKFKAIDYDRTDAVIPGWEPFIECHNTTFVGLDEVLINARIAPNWEHAPTIRMQDQNN